MHSSSVCSVGHFIFHCIALQSVGLKQNSSGDEKEDKYEKEEKNTKEEKDKKKDTKGRTRRRVQSEGGKGWE